MLFYIRIKSGRTIASIKLSLSAPVAATSDSTYLTHSESGIASNSHDANVVEAASLRYFQYNARLRRHMHQQPCGKICGEQRTALKFVEPAWGDEEATIREEGSK